MSNLQDPQEMERFVTASSGVGIKWKVDSAGTKAVAVITSELIFNRFRKEHMEDFTLYRSDEKPSMFLKRASKTFLYCNEEKSLFIKVGTSISVGVSDVHTVTISESEM